MQCPKCKADIDADSWYCDQCGEMIMICPKCNAPRKGKRCTQCGTMLVPAKDAQISPQQPATGPSASNPAPNPQPTSGSNGLPPLSGFGKNSTQNNTAQPTTGQAVPPQQGAGGTMRPQPTGPTRMVSVDDPSRVVVFRNGAIIGRTTGDYLNVFGDNGYTSGRHAQLQQAGADWLIIDLGSTNGTTIDNLSLTPNQGYPLKMGQIVEIGYKKFKVQ